MAVQCRAELANEVEPVMKRLAKELPEVDEALGRADDVADVGV